MEEKTEMDRGMGQIPPDKHPEILKTAHKYRIDENDPTWILVNLVVESLGGIEKITNEGTKALREAAVKVTEATAAEVKRSRELAVLEIQKTQEAAKAGIAAALGSTLENEIRNAGNRLQRQSNRPLRKKWLAVMAVGLPIAASLGGWGLWSFYTYAKNVGAADAAAYANPVSKSFYDLMQCDRPGWKAEWVKSKNGNVLMCYPHEDPKGNVYGWRIR